MSTSETSRGRRDVTRQKARYLYLPSTTPTITNLAIFFSLYQFLGAYSRKVHGDHWDLCSNKNSTSGPATWGTCNLLLNQLKRLGPANTTLEDAPITCAYTVPLPVQIIITITIATILLHDLKVTSRFHARDHRRRRCGISYCETATSKRRSEHDTD